MNGQLISQKKVTSLQKWHSCFEEVWKVKIRLYKNLSQDNIITIIRTSNISLVICFEWPLNVKGHLHLKYLFDCSSVHLSGDTWNYTPHYVQFSGSPFRLETIIMEHDYYLIGKVSRFGAYEKQDEDQMNIIMSHSSLFCWIENHNLNERKIAWNWMTRPLKSKRQFNLTWNALKLLDNAIQKICKGLFENTDLCTAANFSKYQKRYSALPIGQYRQLCTYYQIQGNDREVEFLLGWAANI